MAETENKSSEDGRSGSEGVIPNPEERLASWLKLTARVPDDQMYTWESQARQYPATGPPGISYFRGDVGKGLFVDCLLYRDERGELIGILNHYPNDIPPFQREGDENVWVHPARRRQGIGTALALEASIRWTAKAPARNPGDVRLTESGAQWVEGTETKITGVVRLLPVPPDVVYAEWLDVEGMREWIWPLPAVVTSIEIDPKEGGSYRINVNDQGSAFSVSGRYLVLDPPRGLAFTWHSGMCDTETPDSWVNVSLEPSEEARTLLTIRHGQLPAELRDDYADAWGRVSAQLEGKLANP